MAVADDTPSRGHVEGLEVRILGPPEVLAGGRALRLGGAKQRTLLAVLALHANRVLPADELIDALWDGAPPATAVAQLQAQVSALRAVLARGDASEALVTQPPGYLLRVAPQRSDLEVFERTCDSARHARHRAGPPARDDRRRSPPARSSAARLTPRSHRERG